MAFDDMRVLSPGFLDSYWSAGFGTFFQVSALASHWLRTVQIVRQRRRKMTNTAPTSLVAIQQQANPLLSMLYYTLHVNSENDKNKQITFYNNVNSHFRKKYVNGSVNSEGHLTKEK